MNALTPLNVHQPIRLRVKDYLMLDAAGMYADFAKTELIDGEVVGMNAQHRPHSYAKNEIADRLKAELRKLSPDSRALVEVTVAMEPNDAPEPDIVVTTEPRGRGPVPLASVRLIVEVADTTLGFDMRNKAAAYARHGVPEYWVVDLNAARIVRMWQPAGERFGEADQINFGEPLAAATIAGLTIATDGLD